MVDRCSTDIAPLREGERVALYHDPTAQGTVLELRRGEREWLALVDWADLPGNGDVYPVNQLLRFGPRDSSNLYR